MLRHRDRCRLCDRDDLTRVVSLAPTPPANAFVTADALGEAQPCLPLELWFCEECAHVQLLDVVEPGELFNNYVYTSGTSQVFRSHFEAYAHAIMERFSIDAGNLVIDIGSNDGTLLSSFKASGHRVLGIDPAEDIARRASAGGIETVCSFLTGELAQQVRSHYGPARVVTANNVFAHIDDLSSAVDAVRMLLADDGVFVFEVSYLADVYEQLLFDTIYHEHLDYHSVLPLVPFFARHGLRLVDALRVDSHGGSLRGFVVPADHPHPVEPSVAALVEHERALGLDRADTFKLFGSRIDRRASDLMGQLRRLRSEGRTIAGFGAPAKATTLMHHFGLDGRVIDYVVDDSPLKQGLYTPGLHIPVLPTSAIYESPPDYLLILAWNFAESIMANHQPFSSGGGHFIVPLPELAVR
jgi:SAM-dependent methyltransferase